MHSTQCTLRLNSIERENEGPLAGEGAAPDFDGKHGGGG